MCDWRHVMATAVDVMGEHADNYIVMTLISLNSHRIFAKTLENNLKMKCKYNNWKFIFQPLWCDEDSGRR